MKRSNVDIFEQMGESRWVTDVSVPGRARRYIKRFAVHPGQIFMLVRRVSTQQQNKTQNLADQESNLWEQVTSRGGIAVTLDCGEFEGSGYDPYWISDLARIAKATGATLLAESTDRFVRNVHFHPKKFPQLRATDAELKELIRCTFGVPLMSWLDPDMPLSKVKSFQTKRGQRAKGRKGGRPRNQLPGYKKARKDAKLKKVLFYDWIGASLRGIEKRTGVPFKTAQRWIKQHAGADF